jgi:hypothetical protein
MSAIATQPLFELFASDRHESDEPALRDLISGVWDELRRTGVVECPVCAGPMERSGERGRCASCGTVLS